MIKPPVKDFIKKKLLNKVRKPEDRCTVGMKINVKEELKSYSFTLMDYLLSDRSDKEGKEPIQSCDFR